MRRESKFAEPGGTRVPKQSKGWKLPAPHSISKVGCLSELEDLAKAYLPRAMFGYVRPGVEAETAYRANLQAFESLYREY